MATINDFARMCNANDSGGIKDERMENNDAERSD